MCIQDMPSRPRQKVRLGERQLHDAAAATDGAAIATEATPQKSENPRDKICAYSLFADFAAVAVAPSTMPVGGPIVVPPTPSAEAVAALKAKWGTWGCGVSTFDWTYDDEETAYILEGEVTVTPDDKSLPAVTIKAGQLVTFPDQMSCKWDVTVPINKHYCFGLKEAAAAAEGKIL